MAKIIEIYPDKESVKLQIEARKKFGWSAKYELNDRGVYEVTFTRDDSLEKNQKLKELEDDFNHCFVADDYISRYNGVYADKKKFKAFHPIVVVVLVYCIIQLAVFALVGTLFKVIMSLDPNILYDLGLSVTAGGESVPLTADWKFDLNLEEMGLTWLFAIFGLKGPILTLTVELLINILFTVGMVCLAGAILIIIFMIRKTATTKTFYKAEVEYIQNRKDTLNSIRGDLDKQMRYDIKEAAKIE